MTPEHNTQIEYTITLDGNQHDHEALREQVHEIGGNIVSKEIPSKTLVEDFINNIKNRIEHWNEDHDSQMISGLLEEEINALEPEANESTPSISDLLEFLMEQECITTHQISPLIDQYKYYADESAEATLKSIIHRSLELYLSEHVLINKTNPA